MLILLSSVHPFLILSSSQPIHLHPILQKPNAPPNPPYYNYNYKSVVKLDLVDTPLYAFIILDL